MGAPRGRTVCFRVTAEEFRWLAEASRAAGMSPGRFARERALAGIPGRPSADATTDCPPEGGKRLAARIEEMLAQAVWALLMGLSDLSEDDAEQFVRDYFQVEVD